MKNRLFALLGLGLPLGTASAYAQTINLFPSAKQVAKAFYVQSYQVGQPFLKGKCLDYAGAAVFLNDCTKAHTILVREVGIQHNVVLYAGSHAIGIPHNALSSSSTPPTIIPLELQDQLLPSDVGYNDQVFSLDGDSIILSKSRPCINSPTDPDSAHLCPPPPPQLVVQVQNARGANGAGLVVGPRNLSDNEFWDFIAGDGSGSDPTSGFAHVSTPTMLWNAVCAVPEAAGINSPPLISDPNNPNYGRPAPCAQFKAGWNSVIVITGPNDCSHVPGDEPGQTEDIGFCTDMSKFAPLVLPSGVTLRGGDKGRRGTNFGPQLHAAYYYEKFNYYTQGITNCETCMIHVAGDYIRITGLRIRGQSRSTDNPKISTHAIDVYAPMAQQFGDVSSFTPFIVAIDHNDISDWEEAAVNVVGIPTQYSAGPDNCRNGLGGVVKNDPLTQNNVHVARNFVHHNQRDNLGYGVQVGRAFIEGNTFLFNRHAISSGGEGHNDYRAWYNLILRRVHVYSLFEGGPQQVFDMHGTHGGYGGTGGYEVDIAGNTFLGHRSWGLLDHPLPNFELRGAPCAQTDYFRDNVTRQNRDNVIHPQSVGHPVDIVQQGPEVPSTPVLPPTPVPCGSFLCGRNTVLAANNNYLDSPGFSDPTDGTHTLGVGDFDGDGIQDLIYASGVTWYYSPGGKADWRFLSAKPDMPDSLLLGDFDGDGRTDVVAKRGDSLWVSWGGISDWELLNPSDDNLARVQVTDLHVGKFLDHPPGDQRDDIFLADGTSWYLSYGGSGQFNFANTSSFRVKDLRFGVFAYDGDGKKTDVFGVVSNGQFDTWSYTKNAIGSWITLQQALKDSHGKTFSIDRLVVADFDGDGYADVAANETGVFDYWKISFNGRGDWMLFKVPDTPGCLSTGDLSDAGAATYAGIGHFAGNAGADVLLWNGDPVDPGSSGNSDNHLCIAMGGAVPAANPWTAGRQLWSPQDMR